MKISKAKLKELIKEKLDLALLTEEYWPGGSLSLQALVPLAEAVAKETGARMWNIGEILAELVNERKKS